VGFGGLTPDAGLDVSFRGWRPHRNRAARELALMTGMRIQEWSTSLLPEPGLVDGRRPAFADVELKACAKFGRPRSVYVAPDRMELLGPYLLLERPDIVAKAQCSLRRRHRELFVIQRLEADGYEGPRGTRRPDDHAHVKNMKPDLRRPAVVETGDGLDPLALFIGQGGRMLTFSAWDKIRWRAWDRMKAWAGDGHAPVLPRRCWVYHDLRHTFSLQLLIFLTRQALPGLHGSRPLLGPPPHHRHRRTSVPTAEGPLRRRQPRRGPQLKVSARAEKALREAMERLFTGRPARTDGKLTKNKLRREAGVSRATMNRATDVLAD
jgi:hypothetical protein